MYKFVVVLALVCCGWLGSAVGVEAKVKPPKFYYTIKKGGPVTVEVAAGGSVTVPIVVEVSTYNKAVVEPVTFGVVTLPGGVSGAFLAGSCAPECSVELTLTAEEGAEVGGGPVKITGSTAGGRRISRFRCR